MACRGQNRTDWLTMRWKLLACVLALAGCDDTANGPDHLSEYLNRLSTVTGMPLTSAAPFPPELDLPEATSTALPAANQIDLIDFLSLSGCELQINLGRRNTQLGRTAAPSQRLLLDLEFMELAPACIALLRDRGDRELADLLHQASLERRSSLPLSTLQAVLMGPEWQAFWQRPTALEAYPTQTNSLIIASLTRLGNLVTSWLGGSWAASNREFELLLSDLRVGDGGALLLSHYVVARDLARANQLLEAARVAAPLCPYGQPTARSNALNRVVTQFFVGQVQPWLVKLRQRKEALHPPIKALEAPLGGVLPTDYIKWAMQRDQLLGEQTRVIKTHVQTVQRILSGCRES